MTIEKGTELSRMKQISIDGSDSNDARGQIPKRYRAAVNLALGAFVAGAAFELTLGRGFIFAAQGIYRLALP